MKIDDSGDQCSPLYLRRFPHTSGVPITGTSHSSEQTDQPKSYPPKPEGASGLPRWTTKATPAATRVFIIEFLVLR